MNDRLTFWVDLEVKPIVSTITKNTDGTVRVQLNIDGLLSSNSDEKFPFDAPDIIEKIERGEIKLNVLSGTGARLIRTPQSPLD